MSTDTLISSSGTLASIGLAMVGILAAKSALAKAETIADDLFLFSSLGFLIVMVLGYLAQRSNLDGKVTRYLSIAEAIFTLSLSIIVLAAFVLVYAEI